MSLVRINDVRTGKLHIGEEMRRVNNIPCDPAVCCPVQTGTFLSDGRMILDNHEVEGIETFAVPGLGGETRAGVLEVHIKEWQRNHGVLQRLRYMDRGVVFMHHIPCFPVVRGFINAMQSSQIKNIGCRMGTAIYVFLRKIDHLLDHLAHDHPAAHQQQGKKCCGE